MKLLIDDDKDIEADKVIRNFFDGVRFLLLEEHEEKLMNVYSYTDEEISEEKVSLITKTLDSVKNTPLVIFD